MGYNDPPWIFKGRALYQLHLVKLEEAKKYIPDELHIVNFFGYTLGGFYLARYSDSPVGKFDELVALAGLVWNPPTSCAWAARVYVSNWEARNHGRQHCGLPSRIASFQESISRPGQHRKASWWRQAETGKATEDTGEGGNRVVLHNEERRSWRKPWRGAEEGLRQPVCAMQLPPQRRGWAGPRIRLCLPSFSGGTPDCPQLLQYACQLATNVRAVPAAKVEAHEPVDEKSNEALPHIFRGRPVLALAFDNMEMVVEAPKVLQRPNRKNLHGAEIAIA